jgi:predicted  nucleic acid-binding Zn-ribbon protein
MELHAEIDHLKRHLGERDAHIEAMEAEFLKGNSRIAELELQNATWREKYDR